MSPIVLCPWSAACGASVLSASCRTPGLVSAHHPLAEVHADQILLEDVVVEHVLGRLAQVDDPFAEVRRLDPVGHVLRVAGAGRVIVTADAADPARDEVRVPRVLALHEDAVATEDRRSRVALGHPFLVEVDLGVDAEAAHDSRDGVPRHLDKTVGSCFLHLGGHRVHPSSKLVFQGSCLLAFNGPVCSAGAGEAPAERWEISGRRLSANSACSRSSACCRALATWARRPASWR